MGGALFIDRRNNGGHFFDGLVVEVDVDDVVIVFIGFDPHV